VFKVRKDWIFFIGIAPMLLNSLSPLVGSKPVVLIALAISFFYITISNALYSKPDKQVLSASILLLITVGGYIYAAMLTHGYSAYITTLYAQAFYVLPIAMITLSYIVDLKRVDMVFLIFIGATVLQHVIFGLQGHYVSHHMSDGVSKFPGITGHYHNSYIASFALILATEIMGYISDKVSIKKMLLLILVVVLLGMPIFGMARGAILTNLIAIFVYLMVRRKIAAQSILQIIGILFILVMLFFFWGDRINSLIVQQNTYGYSGIGDVINISTYSSESNYTGRVDWWKDTLKQTLGNSPIFGSIFENLEDGSMQIGHFTGSLMHSFFYGTLQDGGALLFILIMYLMLYPIVIAFRRRAVQKNITKIIWLIAIGGALGTNTWMYNMQIGPIYAYLYAYAAISIIRNSRIRSTQHV